MCRDGEPNARLQLFPSVELNRAFLINLFRCVYQDCRTCLKENIMNEPTLNVLALGHLDCQYFRIVTGYEESRMYRSPVSALLIRHPDLGNVLYDTGNSPYHRREYGKDINEVYPVGSFLSVEQALAEHGLRCTDIDMIILSHMHFDHVGGLRYFQGTKAIKNVIVAENELQNACLSVFTAEPHSAYIKSLFDVEGVVYKTIRETTTLAPNLTLFIQQAHTPGVTGLIIGTRSMGNVIVTSDAVYTRESWETSTPPGGPINKGTEAFLANLQRLKDMQKQYDATMLFGHDSEQILEWSRKGTI